MCYCLMKNVLNSFEFTFATCKDIFNENAPLNKISRRFGEIFSLYYTPDELNIRPPLNEARSDVLGRSIASFPTQSGKVKSELITKLTRTNS